MTGVQAKNLGQLLLGKGMLRHEQLDGALLEQRRTGHQRLLGEILVEQQSCTEHQVAEALAITYGVPFARISPRLADPAIVNVLPVEFLQRKHVLPLFLVDGVLTVAVSEPADIFLPDQIARMTGHRVQIVAAVAQDIRSTLDAYLPSEQIFVVDDLVEDVKAQHFSLTPPAQRPHSEADLSADVAEPPVVKFVNACLFNAVREGATDVHIEPGADQLRVRYRIDGRLVERMNPPSRMRESIATRIKFLAGLDPAQSRLPQEGWIGMTVEEKPISLRVSTVPGRHGETIVIHLTDEDRSPPKLEKLGFGYETLKQWKRLLALPGGLILVTGPSGSGKRDTLYAALSERNRPEMNVCSIEDPVERNLPGVNQFEADEKSGFTFSAALRALLRQEPDVLMLSWLRNAEVAGLAAQASLTGRLVLAAMHAADTVSALGRLIHLGVEPYVVGATVAGVLAQRQVRRLCPSCREAYEPTAGEKRQIEPFVGAVDKLYKPVGCERCHQLGYLGRIGVHELLIPDETLRERISQQAPVVELRELAVAGGLKPLRTDGLEKVKAGITTCDEIYRVTA